MPGKGRKNDLTFTVSVSGNLSNDAAFSAAHDLLARIHAVPEIEANANIYGSPPTPGVNYMPGTGPGSTLNVSGWRKDYAPSDYADVKAAIVAWARSIRQIIGVSLSVSFSGEAL